MKNSRANRAGSLVLTLCLALAPFGMPASAFAQAGQAKAPLEAGASAGGGEARAPGHASGAAAEPPKAPEGGAAEQAPSSSLAEEPPSEAEQSPSASSKAGEPGEGADAAKQDEAAPLEAKGRDAEALSQSPGDDPLAREGSAEGLDAASTGTGDFSVTGGSLGSDYSYGNGVLSILSGTPLTVSGASTADRIVVSSGVLANLTLDGVNIAVGDTAFDMAGASVNLTLKGANRLKSGNEKAGLRVPSGSALAIGGQGSLDVQGGNYGAGVGGGKGEPAGSVSVSGGTISATGGAYAAGVGGGERADGGSVDIFGGTVTATGGTFGAGIGGGYQAASGTFSARGSAFVRASSIADKSGQAGWGGVVFEGAAGKVYGNPVLSTDAVISQGSTLTVPLGASLGIGAGTTLANDGAIDNYGGILNRGTLGGSGSVTNHTGDFAVDGGLLGTDYSYQGHVLAVLGSTALAISGSTTADRVVVQSGAAARLTFNDLSIDLSAKAGACAFGIAPGASAALTLGGASVLKSGSDQPGLGVPSGAELSVGGGGALEARGGAKGAGIGGGRAEAGGAVSIAGGTVTSTGGEGGAGVGGGAGGCGGSAIVSGGTLTATGGGFGAAGVGGGDEGAGPGSFSMPSPGKGFVRASSIGDKSSQESWSGVVFEGDEGRVYGSPVLDTDATIPPGASLVVPQGSVLGVAAGTTLANEGAIDVYGGIDKQGAIDGGGTIRYAAKVAVSFSAPGAAYGDDVTVTATMSDGGPAAALRGSQADRVDFWLGGAGTGVKLGSADAASFPDGTLRASLELVPAVWQTPGAVWAMGAGNDITADFGGAGSMLASQGAGSLRIDKAPLTLTLQMAGWTYSENPSVPVLSGYRGDGQLSYAYKPKGAPESAYRPATPTEAGDYTLKAEAGEGSYYQAARATADFSIGKAPQAAPEGLSPRAETVAGKADGAIEGLTAAMEYASQEAGPYTRASDPANLGFAPGAWFVRLAADDNHEASSATRVVVGAGRKLKVELPGEQPGYTLSADKSELSWHEPVSFDFFLAPGWSEGPGFAVKVNGAPVALQDGRFAVNAPETDLQVEVIGVVPVEPAFTQQTIYNEPGTVALSASLSKGSRLAAIPIGAGDAAFDGLSLLARADGKKVVGAFDVSLVGESEGALSLAFKVDASFEGEALTIYHARADGSVERLSARAEGGWASVEVEELSPFLVAAPQTADDPLAAGQGPKEVPVDEKAADPVPQTGDSLPLVPLALAALVSGAALVALGLRSRARRRPRS